MIEGLSHITFVVRDLERTGRLFKEALGAEEVYASGDDTFSLSRERFYLIGGLWIALMEGEPLAERTYNHVALKIAEADFEDCERRLCEAGVDLRAPRPRVPGEGRSLYFYDFDGHLFELHTGTLAERLAAYGRRRQ